MADSLLTVVNRIRRRVRLAQVSSFSENDESNDNIQDVNDAYFKLISDLPKGVPYLTTTSGTFNTADGTRLYSLASGARNFNLFKWSFYDETNDETHLRFATLEYINGLNSEYDSTAAADKAKPTHVYLEGSDQVGLYPVPDGIYTINYKYNAVPTRLSATTDTFLIPDEWLPFIEKYAQYIYEERKGFGSPDETLALSEQILVGILAEADGMVPDYFVPHEGFW